MKYLNFVQAFESLLIAQGMPKSSVPALDQNYDNINNALIVAPHPDDECLMSGFALRLKEEFGTVVHVVPFSLGSKVERQNEREQELNAAVSSLGFERIGGVATAPDQLVSILKRIRPEMIFSPHEFDGHPTHTKAFEVVRDALQKYMAIPVVAGPPKKITWMQTEFWQNMPAPNFLIPLRAEHVAKIGTALMEHKGEVERNPYHLQLPSWYVDQVRRGSEHVTGAGSKGADFIFGQLYTKIELP